MPEPPLPAASPSRRPALAIAAGAALLGLVWRLVLARVYFGHEEEDWGNLQIARGVLDSGFGWIELEHMPAFAWMVAAATAIVGDVELAARIVSIGMGTATVALVAWIGARWYSPTVGALAGFLVALQPEAALYSATPLRESSYTAFLLFGVLLCGERRFITGGLVLAASFLVRFNVAFSVLPALVLAALWLRSREREPTGALRGVGGATMAATLVAIAAALWALFYRLHPEGGTWSFWGGVLSRNTGSAVGDLTTTEHIAAVVEAVGGLLFFVFPNHLGPAALLCAPLGVLAAWRALRSPTSGDPDRDVALRRAWLALCGLGTLGLLMTTAVFSTYEWFHNLYWKWLTPSVPFLAILGVDGARHLLRWLPTPPRMRAAFGAVLLLSTLLVFGSQTRHQVRQSERMYGAQVRLARWIEAAFVPDVGVVADGIPAWYLNRQRSGIVTIPWTHPDVPSGSPEALGVWLDENRIGVVVWFREEWFGARAKAPFLGDGVPIDLGRVALVPVAWSWEYGMLAYAVEHAHDVPPPTSRPPAGTWYPPPGWAQ